jgi:hypothetical protein
MLRKSSSISATLTVLMAVPAVAMATPIYAYQGRRIVDAVAQHADDETSCL